LTANFGGAQSDRCPPGPPVPPPMTKSQRRKNNRKPTRGRKGIGMLFVLIEKR